MQTLPPLSLYIHVPWCVKKCPYCDFNSHAQKGDIAEHDYVEALLADFEHDLTTIEKNGSQQRTLHSIFIGGGTPSLLSAHAYERLFSGLKQRIVFEDDIEITMEANPGTYEHDRFQAYFAAGVNRLSVGVQSFQDDKLSALGRIHCADEAIQAIQSIRDSGFDNFNIDLMHGLPDQSPEDALYDLQQAIALQPAHISWYQLTIEPNTLFYSKTPVLPKDETLWAIQEQGQALLAQAGYQHYEISAYSQLQRRSKHNLNYWQFGDYIGIGAGAHSKLSAANGQIMRYWKTRMPKDYLAAANLINTNNNNSFEAGRRYIEVNELPIEFMMNVLRLHEGVPAELYSRRCGQPLTTLEPALSLAQQKGLLENVTQSGRLQPTVTGRLFLNDLLELFV